MSILCQTTKFKFSKYYCKGLNCLFDILAIIVVDRSNAW